MWPEVERTADLAVVVQRLSGRQRRAQLISGQAGIGKTTLARQVAQQWRDGQARVISIVGLSDLAAVPMGALIPALTQWGVTVQDHADAARALVATVGSAPSEHLVVVDDAHVLDPLSAAVVYQLVRAFGVPTVMTARQDEPLPDAIGRLLHEDWVDVLELGGLGVDQVDDVLRCRFDGQVRPDHVDRLFRRTQGNPLFLREVVETASRTKRVTAGEHGIEIEEQDTPRSLVVEIEARLAGLSAEARQALRLVALVQPVASDVLVEAAPAAIELLDQGVIAPLPGSADLGVAHPLYGEVAARGASAAEREQARSQAARMLRERGDEASRFAAVQVELGSEEPAVWEELEWATTYAYAVGDHALAVALADAALAAVPEEASPFRVSVDRASALSALGELDAADAAFDAAWSHATVPAHQVLIASRYGEHHAYRRFDVASAVERAEQVRAQVSPEWHAPLDVDLGVWKTLLGFQHDAPQTWEADGLAEQAPELALRAAMSRVMTESMRGQGEAARHSAETIARIVEHAGQFEPFASAMFHLQQYFELLSHGEGAAAKAVIEQQRSGRMDDAIGMWTYTLAIHQMYGGRIAEAEQLAGLAVQQLRWRDTIGLLAAAIALQALIETLYGRVEQAQELVASMTPTQRQEPKALMVLAVCQALALAAAGAPDQAEQLLVGAARTAVEHGHLLVAAISLGVCLRLGMVGEAAVVLAEIAGAAAADSTLIFALRDLAQAIHGRDAAAIIRTAPALDAAGMTSVAIDALHMVPRFTRSAEVVRRAALLRGQISREVDGPSLQVDERSGEDLTERQWNVVRLAAERYSSREIAEQLGISVRTVDNHLAQAYRKLGVTSRAGLREAIAEAP